MAKNVVTLHPTASLKEAPRVLRFRGITGRPVLDETGLVVGLLSQTDLVAELARRGPRMPESISEIMPERVIAFSPDDTLKDAAQALWRHKVHRRHPSRRAASRYSNAL